MKKQYYIKLIDRLFNLLVVFEKNPLDYTNTLKNLYIEIYGNEDFDELLQIRHKLKFLISIDSQNLSNHEDVRRVVLKSVNLIQRILNNWR